jgi:hypothetical protein
LEDNVLDPDDALLAVMADFDNLIARLLLPGGKGIRSLTAHDHADITQMIAMCDEQIVQLSASKNRETVLRFFKAIKIAARSVQNARISAALRTARIHTMLHLSLMIQATLTP